MTWARLDDQLHGDPRLVDAGLEAFGLHCAALSWMGAFLTDGEISLVQVKRLAGRRAPALAARLVAAGFWEEISPTYFRVISWEKSLISRSEVLRQREEKSKSGRAGARSMHAKRHENGLTGAMAGAEGSSGAPSPVPSRSRSKRVGEGAGAPASTDEKASKPKKPREAEPETEISPDWKPDPASYPLGASLGFDRERVDLEAGMFRDRALSKGLRFVRWHAAFHNALRMARKFEAEKGIPLRPVAPEPADPPRCPPRSAAMEAAIKRLEEERLSPEERTKRMNEALERVGRAPRGQLSVPFAAVVE